MKNIKGIIANSKTKNVFVLVGSKKIKITPENEKEFGIILGKK